MIIRYITLFLAVFSVLVFIVETSPESVQAQTGKGLETGESTGLPLPRFVSVSSDKARSRSGPGLKYPVEWVYQRKNLPVEVVNEFENWRKILDIDGQGGWMHRSLLSNDRTAIINASTAIVMREAPIEGSGGVAALKPGVIVDLERCIEKWCRVRRADFSGWIERNYIWGIYESEQID